MYKSHELPPWARYNHVVSGYRFPNITKLECVKSILQGCNESVNAITMVVAAFISCGLYVYALHNYCKTWFDVTVYSAFLASCLIHAPFSIAFHTFRCISKEQKDYWRNLDISFVLIASVFLTFALSAFVFSTQITLALTALSGIVACVGIHIITTMHHTFHDASKTYKYTIVGCVIIPILIYLIPMVFSMNKWAALTIGALLCGLFVYVAAIPERLSPGTFDSFGHSHNIMHMCLIVAHVGEFLFMQREKSGLDFSIKTIKQQITHG